MLLFNLFVMSVQINSVVPIVDVMHLVRARTPRPSVGYVDYHTIMEKRILSDAHIVSTKLPDTAFLVLKAAKLHIFLHDTDDFCRCLWGGYVTHTEKKRIASNLMRWIPRDYYGIKHRICDTEDAFVFSEAAFEIELDETIGPLEDLEK